MIKNAVKGFIVAFGLALALPAGANAANETLESTFSLEPQEGSFFNDAFKAANWRVENTVSVPALEPEILPSKVIDIGNPQGEMTFNPGEMPVCPDSQVGPPPTNVSVPVDVIVARCPDSVLGNGVAQFALNRVPSNLLDAVIVAFNGGLRNGHALVKTYSYSYATSVGLYTEAELTNAGRLKFDIPPITSDSSVTTLNLALPGNRTVLTGVDPGGGDVILPKGQKADYVQAKCSYGGHPWDTKFTFGTRDAAGNPTSPDTFASDSGVQACVGVSTPIPETTITSGPSGTISADEASFEFSSSEPGSTFECELDGGGFSPCSSPKSYSGLAEGAHSFAVKATAPTGKTDPSPATRSFTVNTTPPDTQIDSGPTSTIATDSATFEFSGTPTASTAKIQCRIDAEPFADCTSPKTFTGLADGPHTAEFRAENANGKQDPTPATRSFTVDMTPPETQIDSGPNGATVDTTPTFGFSASEPSSFECRLYLPGLTAPEFTACSGPGDSHTAPGALPDADYVFEVRATDTAGNADPTPATRTFTVDTTPPETTITSGPSGTTNNASPSFAFTSSESGSTFECELDGGGFSPCSSPKSYSSLPDGAHNFKVRATDPAGNVDPTPASRDFTVDTTVYKAKIKKVKVKGPAKVKRKKKATYKVRVINSGNARANGVKLKVKGKGVKARKTVGSIAAGKTKTVKVRLRFKKPGKVKATFKVTSKNAGGKTVRKKIRVRR